MATPSKKNIKTKSGTKGTKKPPVKVSAEEKRRIEWEVNNELISEAFFTEILKNKKFPTYESIAKKLNLNEKTVRRHLQDDEMFQDLKTKMNALKNKALLTLAIRAIEGKSHQFMRLFFEVTDEVKDKGNNNNFTININGKPASASN